jgi:hypothetical protein
MNWDPFGGAYFIVLAVLIGAGQIVFQETLREVNGKSTPDQKISTWWATMKLGVVLQRHRKLFPQSKKRSLLWLFAIPGFSLFTLVLTHYLGSEG